MMRLRAIIGRLKRSKETPPVPVKSEKEQIFDAVLAVSTHIHRAERLKQFGKENDIDVGVSGSDAYIAMMNNRHDDLMARYRELLKEEGDE